MKTAILLVVLGTGLGFGAGYWYGGAGKSGAAGTVVVEKEERVIGRVSTGAADLPAKGEDTAVTGAGMTVPVRVEEGSSREKGDFLKTLAAKDPQAAIDWAIANSEENERDDLFEVIAEVWAKKEPQAAFDWANGLALAVEREDAIRGVMKGALEAGNEAIAMAFIAELPPGEFQDTAMNAAVKHLASRDLERALGLAAVMGETYAMRSAGRAITEALLESGKIDEARNRVANLPYGELRRQLTIGMVEEMAKTDLEGAMEWIAEAPTGPDGDALFDDYTLRSVGYYLGRAMVSQGNPADAIKWAETMGDKRTREYYMERVGEAWAQRSPGEAASWLMNTIESQGFEGLEKVSEGIFEEWIELDQNAPFEMIAGIANPEDRTRAAFMALNELAGENPRIAAERLGQWESEDPEKAKRTSSRIMQSWLRRDPEQASIWLSEQPAGSVRDSGIEQLVRSVLREEKDYDTAQAWAGEVRDPKMAERLNAEIERYRNPKKGKNGNTKVFIRDGVRMEIQNGVIIRSGG